MKISFDYPWYFFFLFVLPLFCFSLNVADNYCGMVLIYIVKKTVWEYKQTMVKMVTRPQNKDNKMVKNKIWMLEELSSGTFLL